MGLAHTSEVMDVPVIAEDESWTTQAACTAADPDRMFVTGAAQREVRAVCFACPVRMECLVEAFEQGITYGVWGGLTERERRAMLRGAGEGESVPWRERLEVDPALQERFAQEQQLGDRRPPRRRSAPQVADARSA